jgi:Fe2+ or Zn2+ uptake regulation protein
MRAGVKPSARQLAILRVFLAEYDRDPASRFSGAEISRRTRFTSASVYKTLHRLKQQAVLESARQQQNAKNPGRLRRRPYRLTVAGVAVARESPGQ